ncbi:hypothetical protein FRB96_000436 [Tulasnella sp. 330]|nr:hypothetical protein FRB96_000436 [Tulasnella sp. 330]KAG8881245.1 hypothetical protein FRB97_009744 [Tulasnella sp. 331]KAG8887404.1 hypothetical protein FRB98_009668 [Tulasnella sp. 332]
MAGLTRGLTHDLAGLKLALTRRSRSEHDIHHPWTALHRALERDNSVPHWLTILESRCIPDMLEKMIPDTIRYEPAAAARSIACLYICHLIGSHLLRKPGGELGEYAQQTAETLELIEDTYPSLYSDWWTRYRYLVPVWVNSGMYMPFCMSSNVMFRAVATRRDEGSILSKYREAALDSYPIIRDALVTYAILAPCRTEEERADVIANVFTPLDVIPRVPSPEEMELPTSRLLLKRTPDVLHQRVKLLLGDHVREDFASVMVFIRWLGRYSDLHYKLPPESIKGCFGDSSARMVMKSVVLMIIGSGAKGLDYCANLLVLHDFLSLIAKVIYLEAVPPNPYDGDEDIVRSEVNPGVWVDLRDLLIKNRKALLPPLRRDFLNILGHLRALLDNKENYKNVKSHIEWWEGLGRAVGLTETGLRDDLYRERQKIMGDVVGCSWVKCMMYEQECDTTSMFRCAGCERAMYCGLWCQERDWSEGGHSALCKQA